MGKIIECDTDIGKYESQKKYIKKSVYVNY